MNATNGRRLWAIAVMGPLSTVFLAGCPSHRKESCHVATAPTGGLPLLLRVGVKPASMPPAPQKPLCTAQQDIRFECEAVDDLSGLLGTGLVCGPGGIASQRVCPTLGRRIARLPQPTNPKKPCGEQACENVEIVIDEGDDDTTTQLTFYDDPSCHGGPPEPACQRAVHRCYYRLLSTTVNIRGPVE